MELEDQKKDKNPMVKAYNNFVENLFDLLNDLEKNSERVKSNDDKLSNIKE